MTPRRVLYLVGLLALLLGGLGWLLSLQHRDTGGMERDQ